MITSQLEASKGAIEQSIVVSTLYTFRDFDNDSLKEYIAVLKSPGMKRFNVIGIEGLSTALENAMKNMVTEFTKF